MTLTLMAGCGMVLGVCFDTIGVAYREFRLNRAVQALIDVMYWGAATLFVFRVLLYANDGEVRTFVFLGLIIGVLVYFWLFGKVIQRIVEGLIRVLKRIYAFLYRVVHVLVVRPLLFVYRILAYVLTAVAGFIVSAAVITAKYVVQWSRLVWRWMMKRF